MRFSAGVTTGLSNAAQTSDTHWPCPVWCVGTSPQPFFQGPRDARAPDDTMIPRRGRALLVHALSISVMAHGLLFTRMGPTSARAYHRKAPIPLYLTIQALIGSWACMTLSLIQDVFPGTRRCASLDLRALAGFVMANLWFADLHPLKRALSMVFLPLGFVVSGVYWSLRIFAPSLILPAKISSPTSSLPVEGLMKLPFLTDLTMHLAPLLSLLTDFLFFDSRFSTRQMTIAPLVMIPYAMGYAGALEYLAMQNGSFPYPFLDASSLSTRLVIYVGASYMGLGCLSFLNFLHTFLHFVITVACGFNVAGWIYGDGYSDD
ncbi:FAR-17a/AIG1-like protein-domain-containing protein [Pisolithus orientalis]|uniref:FAR-17a/AIG1-like protein-domain-containing protein n=1 Tax=Pisolithus orientalis TaxID=936130 RepID=UPI0022250767|nr:FAR-17a/AIG1-like protein-domain-containing protein [Pisolithus orientalis]KAI5997638.1 FAR-17a/AIG1-like protein-domain-containing protein [Pisolithus orientalis]